jgi:hypothetical protein
VNVNAITFGFKGGPHIRYYGAFGVGSGNMYNGWQIILWIAKLL